MDNIYGDIDLNWLAVWAMHNNTFYLKIINYINYKSFSSFFNSNF